MYNISNQGKIMRKLLGKPTVESSHDSTTGVTSSPNLSQQYRPTGSQNAVYPAGVPIGSIDKSPDGQFAVLAGRHVLKTVYFDGLNIKDGIDLRALITAQIAGKAAAVSSASDQLSIKDVKWASGHGDATIFTACANGKIFQYDLTLASSGTRLDFIQMREDSRQVNALDVNPHRGTYLLSGSQDGIVRCFDIRQPIQTRVGLTFRAVQAFKCNADGVRLVKWSPKDGFFFASATEQGIVLKWDIRKASAPMLRINAHDKSCTTISWHADGDHLISGGWDSKCHVWDVSKTADKRQKPKYTISAPAPVSVVTWRPGQWSATAQSKRAAQVAVSYDESSQRRHGINAVHVWDLARPTMPFKEITRFDRSPNAMLWHGQDLLWTAGQDGLFAQCDVAFAPKVLDRQTVSAMDFSARGDVLMFLDERPQSHRPRPHPLHQDILPSSSYSSSPTTPMLSVSRSDSEDDVVGSFLGPRKRAGRRRRPSTRSTHGLSTTPPTSGLPDEAVLSLEQAIKVTGIYKPQQAMAIGHVPAAANVDVYEYLSVNYLVTLNRELPFIPGGKPLVERVGLIMEHYARAAENVSQFRLAQTWRILAYGMNLLLRRRAQYHLEKRMERMQAALFGPKKKQSGHNREGSRIALEFDAPLSGEVTPRRVLSAPGPAPGRSLLAEEIESTSNVPTPLARPVSDSVDQTERQAYMPGKKLTPVLESDSFNLGPAIQPLSSRTRLNSVPLSVVSQDSGDTQMSSTEGYDFYDLDAISQAIDVPVPKKKEPLVLDYIEPRSPNSRKPVLCQDSDESFAQMFSISAGSRQTTGLTGSSEGSMPRRARIENLAEHRSEDGSGGEYESRARGKEIEESPKSNYHVHREVFEGVEPNITQMTDEHHLITQTTTDSLESRKDVYDSRPIRDFDSPPPKKPSPTPPPESVKLDDENSSYIIETDYLPWPDDPPYPHPISSSKFSTSLSPPLNPFNLVSRALAFEVRSSALNASAIVLLLKPLVASDVIDEFQAGSILRQHHARLMSMKLFIEAALLRNMCLKGWPGDPLSRWGDNYPALFTPAQVGVQVGFLCTYCRKPREIDRTSGSTDSIWCCERCKSVMMPCAVCGHRDATPNILASTLIAVLESQHNSTAFQKAPNGDDTLSTWWYCHGCGHGGHATCLMGWHGVFDTDLMPSPTDVASSSTATTPTVTAHDHALAPVAVPADSQDFSGGCCPLDGCGHACLPGRWRAESAAARSDDVSRAAVREAQARGSRATSGTVGQSPGLGGAMPFDNRDRDGVRTDVVEVAQSRAVESVREVLGVIGSSSGSPWSASGGGLASSARHVLSSSPGSLKTGMSGLGVGERDRRKSVKFVAQDEER